MFAPSALWLAFALQNSATPLQKALVDLRAGQYETARKELEEVTRAEPGNAYAWAALAEASRRVHQTEEANHAAEQAAEVGSSQPAIQHALSLFYAAEAQYGRAAKLEEQYAASPKADPQALARAASLYQQAGDEPSVERVYKSIWEHSKTDPQVAFECAQLRLHKLDFSGAAEAVEPALATHPDNTQLVLTMGVARYGQRRFEEAIDAFLQVIRLDPAVPQPYEFLGRMLEQAGSRLPEISKATEVYAAKNPTDAEAQLLLAKVRLSQDVKDGTAESLLRQSLSLDPKIWETHYQLGVLLEAKRDFRGAAEELRQAASLNPNEPMPHYHLARVYDRLGEADQARAERQKHEQLTAEGK